METRMKKILGGLFALATVLLIGACLSPVGSGAGLDSDGNDTSHSGTVIVVPPETTLAALIQPIFNQKCIGCHATGGTGWSGTGGSSGGLDLTTGHSYASLNGVATFELPGQDPMFRLTPGSLDSSYLYQKISTTTPKYGVRMPQFSSTGLSANQIKAIKRWIEKGAPQ